jgi:hypothetical protein
MNPSKAWAMLTARGVAFGGSGGGIPELTPAEIARMLQGLARGPFLAGMVKECGDARSLGELERWLWIEAMSIACRERWPLCHGQQYCRRLSGLAIFEFIVPKPNRCRECGGKGYVVFQGNGVECTSCSNTGGASLVAHARCDLAGIPLRQWESGGWSARYEAVHMTIHSWHSDALSHITRAFGRMNETFDDETATEIEET